MFKNYLITLICSLALVTMTACSSKNDQSSLVEDGSDASLGLDSDGALTVGEPNGSADGWNGPAELGERRARSVARYMQNLGVDVNQLSIVSYGEEKPAVEGHDESAWSKNRRAVLNY